MAGVASSALAADLPTTKGPPPAPYFAPPAFSWTGFYIGVNGGWGFTDTHNDSFGNNINGGLVGGTVGYNYQMGQFVIGYEGDVDWADIRGSNFGFTFPDGFGSNKLTSDFMVTERARLGYAWDRTLFFVTGGYAGIDMKGSFTTTFTRVYGMPPTAYRATFPPAAQHALVPGCVIRAHGRPQHRTFREDTVPAGT